MRRIWIVFALCVCVLYGGCGTAENDVTPTFTATSDAVAETTLPPSASETPVPIPVPTTVPTETPLTNAEAFAARGYTVTLTGEQSMSYGMVMGPYPYVDVTVTVEKDGVPIFSYVAAERVVGTVYSNAETPEEMLAAIGEDVPNGAVAGYQVYWAGVLNDVVASYSAALDELTVWHRVVMEGGEGDGDGLLYGRFFRVLNCELTNVKALSLPYQLDDDMLHVLMHDEGGMLAGYGFDGELPTPLDYWMNEESLEYVETRELHVFGLNRLSALRGAQTDMTLDEVIECMGYGHNSITERWEDATYTDTDAFLSYTIGPYCYTFMALERDGPSELSIKHSPIYASQTTDTMLDTVETTVSLYQFYEEYEPNTLMQAIVNEWVYNIDMEDYDIEYSEWDGAQYAEFAIGWDDFVYLHTYAATGSPDDAAVIEHFVRLVPSPAGEQNQYDVFTLKYKLTDGVMHSLQNPSEAFTDEEFLQYIDERMTIIPDSRILLR